MATSALSLKTIDAFYGDSHVLQNVSFELGEARMLGLLGRNGAGKSTCMNVTMGLLPPRRGQVTVFGADVTGLSTEERRDVLKLLMQIPRDVTIVMIEHNMDVALDFAERITLLHFGKVIVEGTRAEVVADPQTREVYLGH